MKQFSFMCCLVQPRPRTTMYIYFQILDGDHDVICYFRFWIVTTLLEWIFRRFLEVWFSYFLQNIVTLDLLDTSRTNCELATDISIIVSRLHPNLVSVDILLQ
jgi:hypothetical protein